MPRQPRSRSSTCGRCGQLPAGSRAVFVPVHTDAVIGESLKWKRRHPLPLQTNNRRRSGTFAVLAGHKDHLPMGSVQHPNRVRSRRHPTQRSALGEFAYPRVALGRAEQDENEPFGRLPVERWCAIAETNRKPSLHAGRNHHVRLLRCQLLRIRQRGGSESVPAEEIETASEKQDRSHLKLIALPGCHQRKLYFRNVATIIRIADQFAPARVETEAERPAPQIMVKVTAFSRSSPFWTGNRMDSASTHTTFYALPF